MRIPYGWKNKTQFNYTCSQARVWEEEGGGGKKALPLPIDFK